MADVKGVGVMLGIILGFLIAGWVLDQVTRNAVGFIALLVLIAGVVSLMLWRGLEDL